MIAISLCPGYRLGSDGEACVRDGDQLPIPRGPSQLLPVTQQVGSPRYWHVRHGGRIFHHCVNLKYCMYRTLKMMSNPPTKPDCRLRQTLQV